MKHSIETILIHGGITTDSKTGAVNTPIYQTSTYAQKALGENLGYEYSRTKNPTRDGVESLIAECEEAKYGFAFSSGMAAISTVLSLLNSGDKIIISNNVYGGTFRILDKVFSNFNIGYEIVDTRNLNSVENAITKEVKAILIETPSNPLLGVTSLEGIAKLAKANGIISVVDNTFMSPYLQKPLNFGIDIVIHSATKYLGGHSDLIAGLVALNDDELAQKIAFLQNSIGGILSPFDSFLLIRGIKTLALRMERHCENALRVAEFLESNKAVKKVYYPFLKNSSDYALQKEQAKGGGGVVSFELDDGYDFRIFFKSTNIITLAESLGGVESLSCHPASMTHASIPRNIRLKNGISDSLIRLSIGIENIDDLINDVNMAITNAKI